MINIEKRMFFGYGAMVLLLVAVGFLQSWFVALSILNLSLISAIMALGVNIQWGYAGLFNAGIMGFVALGGMAAVLTATPPIKEAWQSGGVNMMMTVIVIIVTVIICRLIYRRFDSNKRRIWMSIAIVFGWFVMRYFYDDASSAIEAVDPTKTGFLGGLGLPIIFSWIIGGLLAAAAAWFIGKTTLGLRADYLAIATLGIAEIIIVSIKNEDWLTRGVKNVSDLPRTVPYEIDLQTTPWFIDWVSSWHNTHLSSLTNAERALELNQLVIEASSIFVKLCYTGLFAIVLALILYLAVLALNSPWGRMMRCIRDDEVSAAAMGKDVVKRHLQVFIIGSAIVGVAGAMLTTLETQFTPGSYSPLRFTFIVWIMVIVGGSGNNYGSVLGGFLIWFVWVQAEPVGVWLVEWLTQSMAHDHPVRLHLLNTAQYMRLVLMGLVLIIVMRYNPKGLLPEQNQPMRLN